MSDMAAKQIRLHPDTLSDKALTAAFMIRELGLPDSFTGNLDALSDYLSECREEVFFEAEAVEFQEYEGGSRAAKVLRVISDAACDNPHIHLYLMM